MEHLAGRLPVKRDPFVRHEESAGVSGVERLRGYYDEARNRLRQYLGRDDAMGSGSSTPRGQETVSGSEGEGGAVFQQRPAHCRLEGKTQESSGEEFTDISYSDLGIIITPQTTKLTVNNNYNTEDDGTPTTPTQAPSTPSPTPTMITAGYLNQDCDFVSSNVESGHGKAPGSSSSSSSNSSMTSMTLHHHGSNGSFTLSQLPGTTAQHTASLTNLGDLRLEEVTT